jgi:hypothetical protein
MSHYVPIVVAAMLVLGIAICIVSWKIDQGYPPALGLLQDRAVGVALILFAVALGFIHWSISPARAAPKAESEKECRFLWDLALSARSMAMEKIPVETSRRVVWRMYTTRGDERLHEIADAAIDAAHALPWAADEIPGKFALRLFDACVNDGDMDSILGSRL